MRKTVAGDAVKSPVLEMNGDEEEQRSPRDARRGNSEGAAESLCAAEHGGVAAEVRRKRGTQAANGGGESATGKEVWAREKWRMRRRRGEGTAPPLNREKRSWASNRWAAAVRFVGRHVAQRYTRGKQKPQGGRTDPERQRGSGVAP